MSQVCSELGIADHVLQKKSAAIAATVGWLGNKLKPELPAGWIAYISETYPNGPFAAAATVGEDTLVLDDHHRDPDALGLYAHWSPMVNVLFGKFFCTENTPK